MRSGPLFDACLSSGCRRYQTRYARMATVHVFGVNSWRGASPCKIWKKDAVVAASNLQGFAEDFKLKLSGWFCLGLGLGFANREVNLASVRRRRNHDKVKKMGQAGQRTTGKYRADRLASSEKP